ncbi:MAG: universal stress protein [Alphaproteobacteria bacterium]|nr:universal stress protein [Alphaproteobacteria bacterium]
MLACVDASPEAPAVCAYAAWLARSAGPFVDVLHVEPSRGGPRRVVLTARDRLAAHGTAARHLRLDRGDVVEAVLAAESSASVVVMGRGGAKTGLGVHAAGVLRHGRRPLCLVARVRLPARRALVLLDANPDHHRTLAFAAHHPSLAGVRLDVVVLEPIGMDARYKLALACERLRPDGVEIYPMRFGPADPGVLRWLDNFPADVVVLSREMLLDQERGLGLVLERREIWRCRPALLIAPG